ncbi:unnamed protein product [Urochloa decumbens]|uniref:BHLH domain-containing protein n=1 Tax=Urochloa decumbens TaxID=240449 RepID=A0ABC8VBE7_9POAL
MAQDGPHGHHDASSSSERSFVPPRTVNFLGPAENDNGGSKIGSPVSMDAASKGKEVIPNATNGAEQHGSPSRSEGKNLDLGLAAAAAADAATGDGSTKGKSSMAANDDGELKVQIIMERERRRQMKDMFNTLKDLMPHVPKKVDKATLVGETINYIKALEQTKANLERKKQERALARQAAAAANKAGASSAPVARTAHGMAALSNGWGPVLPQQPAAPAPAPPRGPEGFQTWSTQKVVLSVLSNNEAVINVCVPRQAHKLTLVLSVLSKYGIEVISMQVAADGAGSLFAIHTRVNGAGGQNPSAEDIYKLAVSEIMVGTTNQ